MDHQRITEQIIGCAIAVHRALGPGLLESTYAHCLAHEFRKHHLVFETERIVPVYYDGIHLDCGYRMDFLVEQTVVLEVKSMEKILPLHQAQVLTYMRLGCWPVGLLINFNVEILKIGIRRLYLSPRYLNPYS
ncbi:MAG: GxxExxY protein [Ignavibacteriae bacterium]|nr:GxxExxY protein [Ignavibacteriota bacterium]